MHALRADLAQDSRRLAHHDRIEPVGTANEKWIADHRAADTHWNVFAPVHRRRETREGTCHGHEADTEYRHSAAVSCDRHLRATGAGPVLDRLHDGLLHRMLQV